MSNDKKEKLSRQSTRKCKGPDVGISLAQLIGGKTEGKNAMSSGQKGSQGPDQSGSRRYGKKPGVFAQ